MSWRVAHSLETLRSQVNASAPGRDKSADGTIGDARHQSHWSDHNPTPDTNVVTALDLTHSPQTGFDAGKLWERLRQNRDPRIKYAIFNRRIFSSTTSPWDSRAYHGADPHTDHVHISVGRGPDGRSSRQDLYDDPAPWNLGGAAPAPVVRGKGSWYSQYPKSRGSKYGWVDTGDRPNSNALGVPDWEQGFAVYDRSTLGKYAIVTAPNGKVATNRQTDIGPSPRTGRKIDISAVMAEKQFGYSPSTFPTDRIFKWQWLDSAPKPAPTVAQAPAEGGSITLRILKALWPWG